MSQDRTEAVLKSVERLARKYFLPIIGPAKGRMLAEIVREAKPRRVLELGTLIGYSTIIMGKEMERGAQIITIEIDQDEAKMAEENIRAAGLLPDVKVLIGDALEIIPRLDGEFDLVFIDAEKSEYLAYLQLVEDKLHSGSIIVADNASYAPDYLNYIRFSGKYSNRFIPTSGGGLEVSVKL